MRAQNLYDIIEVSRRYMSKNIVEVDTKTIIRFWLVLLAILLVIFFFYKASAALIIIGISIFLAIALKPLVNRLNKFLTKHLGVSKSHRAASAAIAYSIIVVFVITIVAIVGPVVVNETSKFVQQLPTKFNESIGGWEGINEFGHSVGINNLQEEITKVLSDFSNGFLGNLGSTVISSIGVIGDLIMKGILILVLTLLFMLEGHEITNAIWRSLGSRKEDQKAVTVAKRVVARMSNVISTYASRQVLVAMLDGSFTMLLVFILSLIFNFSASLAVPMGLIAFVFYLIPMFGQIISACLIAAILAFSSPIAAVIFVGVYIIYAQIENNAIAPKIQGDALKLPAVAILAAMIIGMYLFGLVGAILAIPIAGCIRVLIEEYPNIKSIRE